MYKNLFSTHIKPYTLSPPHTPFTHPPFFIYLLHKPQSRCNYIYIIMLYILMFTWCECMYIICIYTYLYMCIVWICWGIFSLLYCAYNKNINSEIMFLIYAYMCYKCFDIDKSKKIYNITKKKQQLWNILELFFF